MYDLKDERSVIMDIRRGDIYMADLSNHDTESACGVRPVIIIQNNKGNAYSNSYVAAVITSRPKKRMPTHISVGKRFGLRKNSTILCEHIVTVSRSMILDYIGTVVNSDVEHKLNKALAVELELKLNKA